MSKMRNFRNSWTQAPVMYTSEFQTPEDGQYRVAIDDVKYLEQDKDGNSTDPTFVYILRVVDGKSLGIRFRKFQTIRTEKNLSFLKGDLSRLGIVPPNDPEEIILALQRAKGLTIDVTVSSREYQGKTYKDCTIDRLVPASHTGAGDPDPNPFVQNGWEAQSYQSRQQQGYQDASPFGGGYPDETPF